MIGSSIEPWLIPDWPEDEPQDELILRVGFGAEPSLTYDYRSNCVVDDDNYVAKDDIERYLANFKACGMAADDLERIKQNLYSQL